MESIDRLREYVDGNSYINEVTASCICSLLDTIEQEVGEMQRALTIDAKPMTDENMAADGWVRLPVSDDGNVLYIGDLVDEKLPFGGYAAPAPIDTMEMSRGASGYVWMVKLDAENRALINPKLLRHHHAPTVEDVLREFITKAEDIGDYEVSEDALIAEFAAKLRLAEDNNCLYEWERDE